MGNRQIHRLTALAVKRAVTPGLYPDGGGLMLRVSATGSKSWIYRFKRRDMGLGSFPTVSLATARTLATEAREKVAAGVDPIEKRRVESAPVKTMTFRNACDQYLKAHSPEWRNAKHTYQWGQTLEAHACSKIGERDVATITVDDIANLLSPIWLTIPQTASRLRGRIENVLAWCAVKGFRDREKINPAVWRGNLEHMMPTHRRGDREHHSAMPWQDVPAFYARLKAHDTVSALALRLVILTASRSAEVTLAERYEVVDDLWTIPKQRMKAYVEHDVPLVLEALDVIGASPRIGGNPYLFPGIKRNKPMSHSALRDLMLAMDVTTYTPHGFRSSFRDWTRENTSIPDEIAELCLAHKVGSEVRRAYARSTLLAKRKELLTLWCQFLECV